MLGTTLLKVVLIGVVLCHGTQGKGQPIKVSSVTLKNHCDQQHNIDVMVHVKRKLSVTEANMAPNLRVKMSVCRSSWANNFCKSADVQQVVQMCNAVKTRARGSVHKQVFRCGLNKGVFCGLKSIGAAWNMATYVVTVEVNDGSHSLKRKVSVTPFLLAQQCANLDKTLLSFSGCESKPMVGALSMKPASQGSNTVVVDQTKLNFTQLMLSLQSVIDTLSKSTGLKDKMARLQSPDP